MIRWKAQPLYPIGLPAFLPRTKHARKCGGRQAGSEMRKEARRPCVGCPPEFARAHLPAHTTHATPRQALLPGASAGCNMQDVRYYSSAAGPEARRYYLSTAGRAAARLARRDANDDAAPSPGAPSTKLRACCLPVGFAWGMWGGASERERERGSQPRVAR